MLYVCDELPDMLQAFIFISLVIFFWMLSYRSFSFTGITKKQSRSLYLLGF